MSTTILSQEAAEALAIVLTIEDQRKSYRRMVQWFVYEVAAALILIVVAVLI